LSRYTDADA